mgnify:FL=1
MTGILEPESILVGDELALGRHLGMELESVVAHNLVVVGTALDKSEVVT